MPAEKSIAASLRRRSSLSRDGVPDEQLPTSTSTPAAAGRKHAHARGSSTSTSVNYPYPSRQSLSLSSNPDEHEELTVDFEDSVHLNSLDSSNINMARNNAYSSLPTTSNGHHSIHDYPSSPVNGSKRRNGPGGRGSESRWAALAKWQKNTIILAGVLIFGLILLNSGKGPAKDYVLKKTNKDGGTATSEEDSKVLQRPDFKNKDQAIQLDTHETGIVKPVSTPNSGSLADSKPKKITSGESCILQPGKQEFQWALMIDAGSTGSRMHVYKFSNCLPEGSSPSSLKEDPLPTLVDEQFIPITPGLSSYRGRPKAAAESLTKLMEEAVKSVPKSERGCTPIAVKATAGLRLLGAKESQDILDEVERWLKTEWPFEVVEDGVVIMDGKDEGVYAWITINYLLGLIGPGKKAGQSAAVMDLGGASTQIVFEPSFPSTSKLSPGDHVYDLNFASEDHTLYQHSHLGYGLMQARRSVHNLVAFTHVWQSATTAKHKEWDDLTADDLVHSPCLVKGGRKTVLLDPPGRKAVNVTLIGTGAGFDACRRVVDVVMAKDALCETEPCAFGGVYQPRLMETFGSGPIYALSYFYDRIAPLGLGKDGSPFTIGDLRQLSIDVCAGEKSSSSQNGSNDVRGWSRFKGDEEAMAELSDRPEYCLDLSFMYSLLNLGYELAPERELVTGKKINDIELGWALGAGIALLEHSSLSCRNPDA